MERESMLNIVKEIGEIGEIEEISNSATPPGDGLDTRQVNEVYNEYVWKWVEKCMERGIYSIPIPSLMSTMKVRYEIGVSLLQEKRVGGLMAVKRVELKRYVMHPESGEEGQREQLDGYHFIWIDGVLKMKVSYRNGLFDGESLWYNGRIIQRKRTHKDGLLNGPSYDYNSQGDLIKEMHYSNDLLHGKVREWRDNGWHSEVYYDQGKGYIYLFDPSIQKEC